MTLVIVGEALNEAGWDMCRKNRTAAGRDRMARRLAITGAVGRKMADLLGIPYGLFLPRVGRINLLNGCPGRSGPKGYHFPLDQATEEAHDLIPDLIGCRVIMLGKRVAKAFGLERVKFLKWRMDAPFEYVVIPHPTGINQWWNDKKNVTRARYLLRREGRLLQCSKR